jgi:hypothetical protein
VPVAAEDFTAIVAVSKQAVGTALPDHLAGRVAGDVLRGGIPELNSPVPIDNVDAFGDEVD